MQNSLAIVDGPRQALPFMMGELPIMTQDLRKDPALTKDTDAQARSNLLLRALADCAAGNQAGVDAILASEGGQLLGVAYRILARHDLAEEALQDAMLQVWRKAKQFNASTGSARGWIFAILRNRCLNILRDGKRLSTLPPDELATLQDSRQSIVPEENWEILAGASRIRDCLGGLDSQSRHIILLAHVAGFSHAEISTRQDVPLGTIKSLIRRGLHALKECLT
ncbi:sigma-70 family RNA polymerase sigma factor [Roseobacter sp. N2S]|uniref:sigma-70 family RNA polymerase sigma factor n=1 Tax=Roseobacter sp. N2S TaxID=2663844 RepID=UPI0028595003|nr:sigma-70 family RNA polymerase sigma factor [Roseobacter sp. N2S]MDR6264619.1 RNA polymerase sigma-70 factor (ECF subfamily) [Roseobacter sp. N2S]